MRNKAESLLIMKLVLLKAFTDRGNRNLAYYLEGSRTNRYTISVLPIENRNKSITLESNQYTYIRSIVLYP